ncbi:hypothetical protein CSC2_38860 [Clostridium zeae]|uniref:YuzL family protein n=1 Tax=Clostridium zeae TaxID=2759022 RepID=A0ABQ1EFJ3_9CLOT|nr:hypothetical protein [Clostridium zeae]GFZ33360.1 hypothetical protein CSC2_38860 [Clostridium zeae]
MDKSLKSKQQSMSDKSSQSQSSKTGYMDTGNSGVSQGNQNTKNKR